MRPRRTALAKLSPGVEHAVPHEPGTGQRGDEPALQGFSRCYVDTASFGPRGIEMAVACFGTDRVLLGTDYPVFDTTRMLQALGAARLDAQTWTRISATKPRRLLDRRACK